MDTPAIVDDHVQEPVEPPHSLTLKEFVSKLKELEAFHLDSIYEDHIFFDDYAADMMLSDIQYMAEDFLITDTGACHWDNINALKDAGYNVTPGEQDSSGWLTGCIHTQKGIILYG